jgi:aryl-alcohol dehydrogenase-like predicted oxidoreductase
LGRLRRDHVDTRLDLPRRLSTGDVRYRRQSPRFQGEHFDKNLELVKRVNEIAAEKDVTPGQLALSWLLPWGDDMVLIPGTKRRGYHEDNVVATDIQLSEEELRRIEEVTPKDVAAGERYADMSSVKR